MSSIVEKIRENEKLYIGDAAVMDAPNISNQEVYVGVRPEGFVLDENGPLTLNLSNIEVMGRDVSVVSTHEASQKPQIRSIISAESKVDITASAVRFSVKPYKTYIFDKETLELREYNFVLFDGTTGSTIATFFPARAKVTAACQLACPEPIKTIS